MSSRSPDVLPAAFDVYVLNGRAYDDLGTVPRSRRELISAEVADRGWRRDEMEGRALVLEYDAEELFPLETKTSVPTAVLSKFFDIDELPILQRPRRVWENEPPIPSDKHERLLALLIWAHLIPEDLSRDDADALRAALKNNPPSLLSGVQQMQGRNEAHPANKIPIYRKEDRSWAVCPPFDREAGDVLVDIRRTDAIENLRRDAPGAVSGAASGADTPRSTLDKAGPEKTSAAETEAEPGADDISEPAERDRSPRDAEPPQRRTSTSRPRSSTTDDSDTGDSDTGDSDTGSAVILVAQLILLMLGLAAIGYAAISLL